MHARTISAPRPAENSPKTTVRALATARVLQRGNVDDRAGAARKTIDRAPGQLLAPPGRAEKCR
jgi:hypothetical protein